MIVWVSGPTGAGKTTLASGLADRGFAVISEELPASLFESFAADPRAVCGLLQREIMLSRLDRWRRIAATDVVFDRSVSEDIDVFCRLHHENALLTDREFAELRSLATRVQDSMPEPDVVVYVTCSQAVLARRVTSGTHPPAIVATLDRQIELYTEWQSNLRGDVLSLDTSSLSATTLRRLLAGPRSC